MQVTKEQIQLARQVDLVPFLLEYFPGKVRKVGISVCLRDNKSIYIRSGSSGYKDYSTNETGNAIDLLTKHLNVNFVDAVILLCSSGYTTSCAADRYVSMSSSDSIALPAAVAPPYKNVFAYLLHHRKIPAECISMLMSENLLYQDDHNNAVFVNYERDYAEIRGTLTLEGTKPFHGCRKKSPDRFWYLHPHITTKVRRVYICESAIDAISLYIIHEEHKIKTDENAYVSIGGVANYKTIDRVSSRIDTVLAVDNDKAGDLCAMRYTSLCRIKPEAKDWNEDLQMMSLT